MGLDILLEALATMKEIQWSLTIVGTGREENKLRSLCQSLQLSKRVTFAGRVSDSELRDLWGGHHGMVIPTREMEGFGLSVIEAWAAGLPVLATKVGALGEFTRHGDVIHLVDACRVEPLAHGLKWCQDHWLKSGAISLDCQRVVCDHYDWRRVGLAYFDLYRSLT
jgi:glycosyltransferase involved in cell wall biosynthesis